MKTLVKDLRPNPFRRIEHYPIDHNKVEALKNSIKETTFWDNILARSINNHFEIAYGHHRLEAIKELGIKEIDIPIKDLDDATMIRIMANENMVEWSGNTDIMLESVQVAKEYLEAEMAKHETWEDLHEESFRQIIDNAHSFATCKREGIGRDILKKFLGKNWTDYYIQSVLAIINNKDLDREAIKQIENINDARVVSQVIKEHDIKKEDQKKIVDETFVLLDSEKYKSVKTRQFDSKGPRTETKLKAATEEAIEKADYKSQKENFNKVFPKRKEIPDLNEVASKMVVNISSMNITLKEIFANWNDIDSETRMGLIRNLTRTFEIIKEKKGSKEWTPLQLTK